MRFSINKPFIPSSYFPLMVVLRGLLWKRAKMGNVTRWAVAIYIVYGRSTDKKFILNCGIWKNCNFSFIYPHMFWITFLIPPGFFRDWTFYDSFFMNPVIFLISCYCYNFQIFIKLVECLREMKTSKKCFLYY